MLLFVTGGAGFIGSSLVRYLISKGYEVVNIDKLTYCGNLSSLDSVANNPAYVFSQVDICNSQSLRELFQKYQPQGVINLAAESHVDRSIESPNAFVQTNVLGTYTLLEASRAYWVGLSFDKKESFRFLHVSTDEVYGSLGEEGLFREDTPYDPRSPYSATKAASDHLVKAWWHTYGLPCLITNCSNNYGPFQFPEKMIPHMLINMLAEKPLPVYGSGTNIRDWLYVDDHVRALEAVFCHGRLGETYNIGGGSEQQNINVVRLLCSIMDCLHARGSRKSYTDLISFVTDRPGHDRRYAIDSTKIREELGWRPQETFDSGIEKTVTWYLENQDWWRDILSGTYRFERIGLERQPRTIF